MCVRERVRVCVEASSLFFFLPSPLSPLLAPSLPSLSPPVIQVLVESSYSGQFGTFLLNNEQERHKVLILPTHSVLALYSKHGTPL